MIISLEICRCLKFHRFINLIEYNHLNAKQPTKKKNRKKIPLLLQNEKEKPNETTWTTAMINQIRIYILDRTCNFLQRVLKSFSLKCLNSALVYKSKTYY